MVQVKQAVVASSAPPPWHSVLFLLIVLAISYRYLPDLQQFDSIATEEILTKRIFPDIISVELLACCRGFIAAVVWITCIVTIFSSGLTVEVPYLPGSKLKTVPFTLTGLKTMCPFTSWSWILLGSYFTLSSYICFQVSAEETVSRNILRLAFALWEMSGPFTILVAAVVRYAIWPLSLKEKGPRGTKDLKMVKILLMHNANVLFAVVEAGILSGMPVRLQDLSLAPLVGCIYVFFSWCMIFQWTEPEHGPQFLYFFFDTTLPGFTGTIAIMALLLVMIISYTTFVQMEHVLTLIDGTGLFMHVVLAMGLCSTVMRFRD